MTDPDLGRLVSIERTARLVSALLSGRDLTRADAGALIGLRAAAVDRQLEAIGRPLPLVREKRRGKLHVRIDRSKIAGGPEPIPGATTSAACVRASRARRFEATRFEAAETAGGTFQYPDKDSYDPERVFADSFGIAVDEKYPVTRIEVSLAARWSAFVQSHRWHRSQESFVRGGRIHVRLRVRLCPEVVAWILGFGPDVRVVEPKALRR